MRTWVISMNGRSHCGMNRRQRDLCEKTLTVKFISQGSTDNTSAVAKQHRCYHILNSRTESQRLKSLNAFGVWHRLWPKAEAQWRSLSASSSQNHLHNRQPTLSSNISSYKEPFNEFTGTTFSNSQVWPFLCMFQKLKRWSLLHLQHSHWNSVQCVTDVKRPWNVSVCIRRA